MPTECSAECFDFGIVEGRPVEAAFDAGLVTSDAGALLLGATDRAIGMMDRLAACFHDERRAGLIEHEVATLVGQRVFGIVLVDGRTMDAPAEAVWPPTVLAERDRDAEPATLCVLERALPPDSPIPVTESRIRFRKLLTALRL